MQVSNQGRIRKININKILMPSNVRGGYLKTDLRVAMTTPITVIVHRVVAEACLNNPVPALIILRSATESQTLV